MHRFLLFKDIYTWYNTELPIGATLLSKIFCVKNLSREWQETFPTKTGLNSISESMHVCKRGLMHKARGREDEGSGLWVSSWLTLLSVHPPPGRMGADKDQESGISTASATKLWCLLSQVILHLGVWIITSLHPSTQTMLPKQQHVL